MLGQEDEAVVTLASSSPTQRATSRPRASYAFVVAVVSRATDRETRGGASANAAVHSNVSAPPQAQLPLSSMGWVMAVLPAAAANRWQVAARHVPASQTPTGSPSPAQCASIEHPTPRSVDRSMIMVESVALGQEFPDSPL